MLKKILIGLSTVFMFQAVYAEAFIGKIVEKQAESIDGKVVIYDALELNAPHHFQDEEGNKVQTKGFQLIYTDTQDKPKLSQLKNTNIKVECKHIMTGDSPYHYMNYLCLVEKLTPLKP